MKPLSSFFLAFILGLMGCYLWIKALTPLMQQPIRSLGPATHAVKRGTPTGGGLVLIIVTLAAFSATGPSLGFISLIVIMLGYGALGAWDDAYKIIGQNSAGLSPRYKLIGQSFIAVAGIFVAVYTLPIGHPWFNLEWGLLSLGRILFIMFVVIGSSNGVNLTDGLDGLAIGLSLMTTAVYAYLTRFSFTLFSLAQLDELTTFYTAFLGASASFLLYNKPPAKLFMGDVGSLSIGAVLAWSSFLLDIPWLFAIMGGVFVLETLSVIVQVSIYRRFRWRFFRMAPLHHHFEQLGWPEKRVTICFLTTGIMLNLVGLWLSLTL